MKTTEKIEDKFISELVQSVKYSLPDAVENNLKKMLSSNGKRITPLLKRPILWYPVSAALATIILVVLLIFFPYVNNIKESKPPISEIKTEFEIPEKNIKIIWVQKKDFTLN